jgi:multiple sugar transport system substrate-binding protein
MRRFGPSSAPALLAAVVLALGVTAGCGGGGGGDGEGTVTFMLPSDNPGDIELRRAQADAFMKDHPDIQVKVIVTPAEGYNQKVFTSIAGGNPPDIFGSGDVIIPTIVEKNYALDLNEFIQKDDFDTSDYYEDVLSGLTVGGKLVGLTDNWDTQVMYYNPAMFQEAGVPEPTADWTWEDFTAAAQQLTSGEGKSKQYGVVYESWFAPVFDAIWSFGGDVFSEDGTQCLLDEPEAAAGVQAIVDLYQQEVSPSPEQLDRSGQSPTQLFLAGRTAMYVGAGRWAAYELREGEVPWKVAPLPAGPAGRANFFHLAMFAISRTSDSPDNAWQFLKYVTSEQGIRQGIENMQGIPALQSLAEDPAFTQDPFVKEHDAFQPFIESLPTAHSAPYVADFPEHEEKIVTGLDAVWSGEKAPADALAEICAAIEPELQAQAGS